MRLAARTDLWQWSEARSFAADTPRRGPPRCIAARAGRADAANAAGETLHLQVEITDFATGRASPGAEVPGPASVHLALQRELAFVKSTVPRARGESVRFSNRRATVNQARARLASPRGSGLSSASQDAAIAAASMFPRSRNSRNARSRAASDSSSSPRYRQQVAIPSCASPVSSIALAASNRARLSAHAPLRNASRASRRSASNSRADHLQIRSGRADRTSIVIGIDPRGRNCCPPALHVGAWSG